MMYDNRDRRPELTIHGPARPNATPAADDMAGPDDGVHWLLAAHEMLVETVLRGDRKRGAPRYIEQFATASRVLLLIPASRPEYSRTVEFCRAGRELAGLARFRWCERHHHVGMTAATAGHRTACLRAEFDGRARGGTNDVAADGHSRPCGEVARCRDDSRDGVGSVRDEFAGTAHAAVAMKLASDAPRNGRTRATDDGFAASLRLGRADIDSTVRCITVTTLEWLPHSLKPRSLSFAIYYDDQDIALTATLQPNEKTSGRECCVMGQ